MTGPYGTDTGRDPAGEALGTPVRDARRRVGDDRDATRALPREGPGWQSSEPRTERVERAQPPERPATVLPPGPARSRPVPPRAARPEGRPAVAPAGRGTLGRARRARLTLKRVDPWSVFLFSLVASVFVAVAMVVAVAVLYTVLGTLGVPDSLNQLFAEVTGGDAVADPLLTAGRIVGGATVLAAVNIVTLTLLATLGALLYNLCASFTGGLELTLGERD